jgi:hypothetical protein
MIGFLLLSIVPYFNNMDAFMVSQSIGTTTSFLHHYLDLPFRLNLLFVLKIQSPPSIDPSSQPPYQNLIFNIQMFNPNNLSPLANNLSIPGKKNLIRWWGDVTIISTHKSPTLGTISLGSCNSILKGLDGGEIIFVLTSGYSCLAFCSIFYFHLDLDPCVHTSVSNLYNQITYLN